MGLSVGTPAHADEGPEADKGGAAQALFACRGIENDQMRLECYDREASALQEAQTTKKVVIVEQETIEKTRRDLFGFTLPNLALFQQDGDDSEDKQITEIVDTIAAYRLDATGKALITLSNGARWAQTDSETILGEPKAGDPITIEQAALGSFKAKIGSRRAIRVKRIN
jgi:hypothetical protein